MHEPLLFPAPTVSKPETVERRNVPTQRAALQHHRESGDADNVRSIVVGCLYGRGNLGLTLDELHERVTHKRPGTRHTSLTQALLDARLLGHCVKTNRSREGVSGRDNRVFVHGGHWAAGDGRESVKDGDGNRKRLNVLWRQSNDPKARRPVHFYGGAVPREYEHWIESEANDVSE